jgi:membrane protease YdiL (CAAX protease family)
MAAQSPATSTSESNQLIASPWHTLFVIIASALWAYRAIYNAAQARATLAPGRPYIYLRTMFFEWVLLAIVIFGVRLRGVSLQVIFGQRWQSLGGMARDLALGISFMVASTLVVSIVSAVEGDTSSTQSIQFLIPQSALELILWVALSITAGICEEAIYRGYFQRQFAALTRNAPAGIVLSGAVFGAVHAYQGWKRAVAIAAMGIVLGIFAHWRKTVRPGMFAHAIQDLIAPLLIKLVRN